MNDALVRIRDLRVELNGNEILRGVTANLERGAITALIGLNGSGKTTLLRALLGEVRYTGRIDFCCASHMGPHRLQHVGYVPQKLNIEASLPITVRDLLALAIQRRPLFLGVSRAAELKMIELLRRVFDRDPSELLNRPVEKISGGELQRVLMGLALHPQPELLMLDEPAAGVDFKDQEKFYDLIARLNGELGVTVLIVSHDLSVVSRHAQHVLCLKDGQIACEGMPQQVLNGEMLHKTFGADATLYQHQHQHERPPPPSQVGA